MLEQLLLLQIAADTLYGQIFSLILIILMSIGTIGDSVSKLFQIIFEAIGFAVPLIAWRIVTIVISILIFWKFIGSMGFTVKLVLGIVIMGVVFGMFGMTFIQEDGIFKRINDIRALLPQGW